MRRAILVSIIMTAAAIGQGADHVPAPASVAAASLPETPDVYETPESAKAGAVEAVARWDAFVAALRGGRMQDAYRCFSPLSRDVMTFRDFCGLYSPLSAATEAVLALPEESRFQFTGDKAVLRYVALPREADEPGSLVQAFMVREDGQWYLVSERRWAFARAEADARTVLRQLGAAKSLNPASEFPADYAAFSEKHPEIVSSPAVRLVEGQYVFELHRPDANGWLLLARPKAVESGLRGFAVNMNGDMLPMPGTGPAMRREAPVANRIPPGAFDDAE